MSEPTVRDRLVAALAKDLPIDDSGSSSPDIFDPWRDVLFGINGGYSAMNDRIAIRALEAVRDDNHGDFITQHDMAAELMLCILSGNGLTNYGTSPYIAWPDETIADLWNDLITKWYAYYDIVWGDWYWAD